MGQTVQNQKRSTPSPIKHFMLPTISAVSKANPPRKKSLAERKESIGSTPLQKIHNFNSRAGSSAEFGKNKGNPLADGSSASSPYDPLTNYLSPRPQFLRYDPNRGHEILLRIKNENKEVSGGLVVDGEEDTSCSCSSLFMHYPEDELNQEDGETDHSDEEIEWVEEEKGWCLRVVTRFLILLVVLVLSTSYISSMNSPNPSPVVRAVKGLKNGYHMVYDHVHDFAKSLEGRNDSLVETEATSMYFARRIGVKEMIEDVKMEGVEYIDGFIASECAESEVMDIVEHEEEEAIGNSGEIIDIQGEENKLVGHSEIVEAEYVSDNEDVNSDLEGMEVVETCESAFMLYGFNPRIISGTTNMTPNRGTEAVRESKEREVIGEEMSAIGNSTDEVEELVAPIDEPVMLFLYHVMLRSCLVGLIIGALAYIFLTLLEYINSKKKRNAKKQSTSGNAKPCSEPMTGQKCDSVHVNAEDKQIEPPLSIMNPGSLVDSVEEDTRDIHQSQAPSIELLSEILVEDMSRNSVLMKGKGNETHSVPSHVITDFSEISTMNSRSHGTSTDENILVNKQKDGADGDDRKVAPTPVRRSSRIPKRAIISP